MKLTIIGAAGVRTPLIIQSIIARQEKLKLDELCLMDIDSERLELIGALTHSAEQSEEKSFHITRTTDATQALKDADFVITTFRVGGIESRAIDERVPLNYGVLGQETTGPGGFAMGIRSIPVILNYVSLMQEFCPNAWLINFANPAGMLTEVVLRNSEWHRVVGICDAPSAMKLVIADALGAKPEKIYIDYFGLNHLGWIRRVIFRNKDFMPEILEQINISKDLPGLPFDPQLISSLKLIPNEYLYYYYYASQSVQHILQTGKSRGEQISALNLELFKVLKDKYLLKDFDGMQAAYHRYLDARGSTYMVIETQKRHDWSKISPETVSTISTEGYAGVALDLIEGLIGQKPVEQILNIANRGAIQGLDEDDVVEIPALVTTDHIQPLSIGKIPDHCLGLMIQVKQYERYTIEAACEKSYDKAVLALTVHPLVRDYEIARKLVDNYISQHKGYFLELM